MRFCYVLDGLADMMVRRARSDGARGLFLVPTKFQGRLFIALRAVAVAVLEPETQQSLYRFTRKPVGRMTLFTADFGDKEADQLVPGTARVRACFRAADRPSSVSRRIGGRRSDPG